MFRHKRAGVALRCRNMQLVNNTVFYGELQLYLTPLVSIRQLAYSLARCVCVKVNQSRYRPEVAQRGSRKLRFPDFMTTVQEGGKVVSLTHRPHLPPGNPPGTHFC